MLVYQSDCCRLQSVQHFCLNFHPNAACQLRAVKQNFSLAFWTERPPSAICLQSVHCPYLFLPPILLLITLPLLSRLCIVSNVSLPCLPFFTLHCVSAHRCPSWLQWLVLQGSGCCFNFHILNCRVLAHKGAPNR